MNYQEANENKDRSCYSCVNLHSHQGDGEVICHVYCSIKDDVDFTFSNSIDPLATANMCESYIKD